MVRILSHSEPGTHADIQDAFDIRTHPDSPECLLISVADGQGGQSGGATAARLACKTCLDTAARVTPAKLCVPESWVNILGAADQAVAADPAAGFTTLVGLCISGNWLCGAVNGDSAVLCVNGAREDDMLTCANTKTRPSVPVPRRLRHFARIYDGSGSC
jgi:serine/threonine protein phosphatase PrpC